MSTANNVSRVRIMVVVCLSASIILFGLYTFLNLNCFPTPSVNASAVPRTIILHTGEYRQWISWDSDRINNGLWHLVMFDGYNLYSSYGNVVGGNMSELKQLFEPGALYKAKVFIDRRVYVVNHYVFGDHIELVEVDT